MVSTAESTQCPAQPKRGWILVADDSLGEQVLKSGLIIPKEIASHITRARILELGLPPIDFRTGGERQWDYHVGQRLLLSDQAQAAWLPMEHNGRKVALVNEAHICGLWREPE